MDWQNTNYGYQYRKGALGEWAVSKLSNGQGRLELLGESGLQIPLSVGIFGSPAEARLAATCYEAFEDIADTDFKAPEGFGPRRHGQDDGWTEKPSGTGSLVLHSCPLVGDDKGVVSLGYHPKRGVRIVHVAIIHFGGKFGPAIREALHLLVALAVAEARLNSVGHHKRPMQDGEELAFARSVTEMVDKAPSIGI